MLLNAQILTACKEFSNCLMECNSTYKISNVSLVLPGARSAQKVLR